MATQSESKEELNGESVTEQGKEVINTKLLIAKQPELIPTEENTPNESSVIANSCQVAKTNGTVEESDPCSADNTCTLEKLISEEKSDTQPAENGTENNNIESDIGNKGSIDTSKIDTESPRTSSEKETSKETISNELKRSIVENVLSRYVQEVKKLKTNDENVGNLTENKCNSEANSKEESDVSPGPRESLSTPKNTLSDKNQAQEIKTVSEKGPVSDIQILNAVDLVPDSTEPAKLDKIDSEINKLDTTDSKSNVSENDKDNDLECPHLEPEGPMELEAPPPVKDCSKSTESLDIVSDKGPAENAIVNISGRDRSVEPESGSIEEKNMGVGLKSSNITSSEKVIVYHEDTLRIVENLDTSKLTCDKEQSSEFNKIAKESEKVSKDTMSINSKSALEAKKSTETVSSKPKGQKLDELLSKIATKATNDLNIPKKAKARKSFSQASPAVEKAVVSSMSKTPASIANLTFNVKMLEKQGVLDIPKPQNKRKAFEPFKLKVKDSVEKSPAKVAVVKSPVKSPKKDSPYFNTNKVIKGRRRKKKKMGSYKLPSEKKQKTAKDRKKASEERQISGDERSDKVKNTVADSEMEVTVESDNVNNSATVSYTETHLEQQRASPLSQTSAKSVDSKTETESRQQTTLDDLIKKSKLFTNSTTEKTKETVRSGIEQQGSHTKTLDAFLKRVSQLAATTSKNVSHFTGAHVGGTQSLESQDVLHSGLRKRKAVAEATNVPSSIAPDKSLECQDEKKRKTDIPVGKSPPPPMRIMSGSPPFSVGRPIVPAPVSIATTAPVTFTQLASPNSKQPPKAIIQNGTLNGLPVFQIISNGTLTPGQIVAIGNQGQSLLPGSLPKTAILQSPPRLPGAPQGMPVILTPVAMPNAGSSAVLTQTQNQVSLLAQSPGGVMNMPNRSSVSPVNSANQGSMQMKSIIQPIAAPIPLSVFNQSIVASSALQASGQLSLLNQLSKSPLEQHLLKPSHIPNGLYPVTPPKTPDDQAGSDTGSQESAEVSPGQQVSPDKDVIPLCTCKLSGASFPKLVASVTFCQALDSVDSKAMGCCNKVTNSQLVRPAVKIPFMAVCEHHRKRLKLHQCCPGCGHFCTQGKFLQCRNEGNQIVHNFHEQCQVIKDGKNYCPHCGEASAQVGVHLMLQEKKPQALEWKSSRIQIKAKMAIADKKTVGSGDESSEETTIVLEKTKKILSTADIPIGPDKHSLERVLSSLSQERPKKYRHLPKCLYTPAYDNDLDRVVYMLEDGHDANEKYEDLEGQGAIHAAAAVGSLPIVHALIQAGASPHLQDRNLRTPLSFAAENNHQHVVKYLLKVGSVIDSKADDGMTSLHYAAKAGHVGIIKVLLDVEGLNIDVKDDGGYTPLIWAAEHEQLEVVKYLLKRNADPNLRDSEENTALHWAAFSGSVNVSEVLLNTGCELDSLNMHGDRPLHIASRQDHYECVVLFLARGADVDLENNKGEIPAKCCIDENSPTHLALKVNKQLKSFGAKHMGRPEKLLTRDISKGRENIPIPCVNAIDDDGIPTDYLYVTDNVETTCLNVNRVIGSLQSCQCKDDCSSIYCACGKSSVRCWYDRYGRLVPEFNMLEPSLIFECNRACECWTTCNNRVVQNGVMSRLQVFKTEGRGWGCKTLVPIPRGTFICEYIGEHISDHEADRREDDSYLFDLDNKDGETYCIDARKFGNIARFINHLCEPNLVPVKVFVDSQDLRFPRICLFASKDIQAQEELGFDYGEKFWIIKWKHFTCTCGSPKCRYSKETIHRTIEEYRARHEEDLEATQE